MSVINNIITQIINPLIVLLFAAGLLYFFYGLFEFVKNSDSTEKQQAGKNHMLYGIIGLFIMAAAFGLMNVINDTISSLMG